MNEFMGNDNNDTRTTTSEHRNKCPFLSYQSQSFLFCPHHHHCTVSHEDTSKLMEESIFRWQSISGVYSSSPTRHTLPNPLHHQQWQCWCRCSGLSYLRGRSQTFRIHKRMKIVISWMGLKFLINLNLTSFRCFLPLTRSNEGWSCLSLSLVCDWLGDSIGLRNRTRHLVSL